MKTQYPICNGSLVYFKRRGKVMKGTTVAILWYPKTDCVVFTVRTKSKTYQVKPEEFV